MDRPIKTIATFIAAGLSNTLAFIVYLRGSGLPGGAVGMAPFLIAWWSLIAITVSTVLYLLIQKRIAFTTIKAILIYQAVYLLTLIGSGENPFDNRLTDIFSTLTQWIYLLSFLVTIALIVIAKVIDVRRNKVS